MGNGRSSAGKRDLVDIATVDIDPTSIRQMILESAIAAIEAHGEASVRVIDVAAQAGVKHPSVYHYFGSRDGLVVAAQAERYRRSIQFSNTDLANQLNAATTRSEYIAALDVVIRSFSDDAGVAHRRVRREVLGSAVFRPDLALLVRDMIDRQVEDLIDIFSHGRGKEWVTSPYELRTVMLWWLGTIQGRQFIDERSDTELSKEWDDLVARAVVRALFGAEASPDPDDNER